MLEKNYFGLARSILACRFEDQCEGTKHVMCIVQVLASLHNPLAILILEYPYLRVRRQVKLQSLKRDVLRCIVYDLGCYPLATKPKLKRTLGGGGMEAPQ
jgi:hypothetical protein